MFCRLLLGLMLLCLATPALGATYYVRKTGNNGNTGTAADQAWLTIQKAATTMVAGDTVYVGAGTYAEYVQPTNDGTAINPIRFIADTSGVHTGDVGNVIINGGAGNARAFEASGDNYIQIYNFRLTGGNQSAACWASSPGGLIANCELDNSPSDGVVVRGTSTNLTIQNCWLHDHADYGIDHIEGAKLNLVNCTFERNAKGGIGSYGNASNVLTASRCRFLNNPQRAIYLQSGTSTITNCLVLRSGTDGIYAASGTHTLWHNTIAYNTTNGIWQANGTINLRNSIIASNTQAGLRLDAGTMTHTYNCIFGNTAANFTGTAASTGEITTDPKFWSSSYFELQDSSPCLNTGTNPGGAVIDDLEGHARPVGAGYDMGCYETTPITYTNLVNAYTTLQPYAWWRLNETSGSTAADAIVNHPGTYQNGTLLAAKGPPIEANSRAANFDGVDDRVSVGTIDPPVNAMSFVGWMKADAFTISDATILAKTSGTADANYFWGLSVVNSTGNSYLQFRFRSAGSTALATASTGALSTQAWVFVAGVYDGQALVLYKDGVEVARTTKSGLPDQSAATSAAIGDNPGGLRPFDGLLDEVAIFTKALSPRQIAAIYASSLKGNITGLVTTPKLWGVDEDDSQLFMTTSYPTMAAGNTSIYGRLKWNNAGTITNLPGGIAGMTMDRYGKIFMVSNMAIGSTSAPVLMSFDSASASASQNNVVSVIGNIPVSGTVNGLAIDPISGGLYALRNNGWLYVVNTSDASVATTIGQIVGQGETVNDGQDCMFDPYGNFYVLDNADEELYRIHKTSAAVLEVYNNGGPSAGQVASSAFDHLNSRFVAGVTDYDMLIIAPLSITGYSIVSTLAGLGLTDVQALAFNPGEGVYGNASGVRIIHWKEVK